MAETKNEAPTDTKTELAEDRTSWAQDRTLLANDRTFSAWIRTGLATMAAGFAATRLLPDVEPALLATTLGALLVITGGIIILLGYWRYRRTNRQLVTEEKSGLPGWVMVAITAVFLLSAGAGLWLIV